MPSSANSFRLDSFAFPKWEIAHPAGQTIDSILSNDDSFYVPDEVNPLLKHSKAAMPSTCDEGSNLNNSNFFITLGGDLSRDDGKRSISGEVSENFDLVAAIGSEPCDPQNRPFRDIRILQTELLHDPFEDPLGFSELQAAFVGHPRVGEIDRIEDDEILAEM
jgi:hypothetical protein